MADRRTFIAGMVATGLIPKSTWADAGNPAYLSAGMKLNGTYVLCGLNKHGEITFELPLPDRGHAAAAHPLRADAVAFARRPGTYAIILDCTSGREKARLEAPSGRHFYGHGAFSADGELLFTTENDYEAARGVVGVWDARQKYKRLGEFASGGVGPHDVKLMPSSATLVVANGGIETHPETGRTKLNLPSMRPNLCYLDFDGHTQERVELSEALRKNSIRHLAVSLDATVAFAMQWQGDVSAHPPLLGTHRIGEAVRLIGSTPEDNRQMAGYAGSIAISETMGAVAVTSPRGGAMQVFDMVSAKVLSQVAIEDVCGVSAGSEDFVVTNGLGGVFSNPTTGMNQSAHHPMRWDNHLVPI